ncbi:hypothetical protein HG421_17770 [Xanthomonas campestris pv. badrii]|uniref:Uncharacterized protein n=1 Tax=Xanthomonas campestris pv. badrii TaxID=149696 RepID=A0A7Z2VDA3_XANCA|nr:hypothetical protein [Xanthomonas campestris]MCC4604440.1 hypothetical protein [Xanthomonas campestris pv. parthenii]QJD69365.1 hypothetical protein HG421_17770 [Xanthomonas campestris pv. badrii]
MQCENIVLIPFYHGDGDQELADNLEALSKKYKGRTVRASAVTVVSAEFGKSAKVEEVVEAIFASSDVLGASRDNGLYFLIHAGATQSNPSAVFLAEVVAGLAKKGICFRKINLAGCFTGGNKLGNVASSVLAQFTRRLVELIPKEERGALLTGLGVSAYLTEVTTFYEESVYYQGLILKQFTSPAGLDGIHNLVQRTKEKSLSRTHPDVLDGQAKALVDFNRENFAKIYDGKAYKKVSSADPKTQESVYIAQRGIIAKKITMQQAIAELVAGYEMYMRTKVVAMFDDRSSSFIPGSIASYTDNDTVKSMIVEVERMRGSSKYTFHL